MFHSEHKHCDNAATNSNSENARSRMEASMLGSVSTGDKGRRVKHWARLGCSISPCYGPFSLGALFETSQKLISLIFEIFFSDRGKPRIHTHTHTQTHTCIYIYIYVCVCVCVRARALGILSRFLPNSTVAVHLHFSLLYNL